jgi:integrase
MATISRRGAGWYVQVRRKGYPTSFRTFATRRDAAAWAVGQEAALGALDPQCLRKAPTMTVGDLLRRYLVSVTPSKRSADSESWRVSKMLRASFSGLGLAEVQPSHIAAYRDWRLETVKPGTVRRELSLLRTAIEVARREWSVELRENPVDKVRRPVARDARDRRLSNEEWRRLETSLRHTRNKEVEPFVRLALETALRRGELLALRWRHIDLERRVALIPDTKTGQPRTIPLSPEALRLLASKERTGERVLNLSPMALRRAWERLCARANVEDLRVHDLRHEALSRFSELGLNTPELATISGHKDVRMLLRYTHIRPAELALKLAGRMSAASSP